MVGRLGLELGVVLILLVEIVFAVSVRVLIWLLLGVLVDL